MFGSGEEPGAVDDGGVLVSLGGRAAGDVVEPIGATLTTLKRVAAVPELPTVAESGVPGFEIAPWGGIVAPAGIPKAVLNRLNADYNTALQSQTVREFYNSVGVQAHGGTPEQFTEHVRKEAEKWGTLIKRLGIKPAA